VVGTAWPDLAQLLGLDPAVVEGLREHGCDVRVVG